MMKEIIACLGGVAVGVAVCYCGYHYFKKKKTEEVETDVFEEKLKRQEEKKQKLNELITSQTYVELLTARELTDWFRKNKEKVISKAKMMILIPSEEHMRGLGYPAETDIDVDTNVVQLFYDEDTNEAVLVRLVNYTDIESNLQAKLIENDGMLVVTE